MQPEPCHANTTDDLHEDLWRRLSATRWPDELDGAGRDYGFTTSTGGNRKA